MPFAFGRHAEAAREGDASDLAFTAFSADCRITGRIALRVDRLTDQVNGPDPLEIGRVVLEALTDGRQLDVGELTVERDELCAIAVEGPRGDPQRRLRTTTRKVDVRVGPYHVEASVHGTPASDPLAKVGRGPAFVPLTDAIISYETRGEMVTEELPVVLINRNLARTFRAIDDVRELVAREIG